MISIIIPVYNSQATITQTLKGLERQTRKDFEVIIVDDGSIDASLKLITEFRKKSSLQIKLISQENSGPAKARNVGVEHSKGEIIIFLDSDCIPPENWIEEMVSPIGNGIVGCTCGYRVKNKKSLVARYVNYEIARRHKRMMSKDITSMGSYSLSCPMNIFEKAGGFDAEYTTSAAEDFDLAFRIRKFGKLKFTKKTFVYHYHPDSLRKYLKQQYKAGYWRVKLYLKHKDKLIKGDSYTRYEPQIQFILSGFSFLSIPLSFTNPLFLLSFFLLFLSNLSLGIWICKKEKKFIILAPFLASLRSLAGSIGVYIYFIKKIFRY